MNFEEQYCKAERDYDAHREELLMTTKDDQIDNSKWQSFFETDVRYWSTAMIKQAQGDLIDELNRRPGAYDYPIGDKVRDAFAKKVQEIEDMKEPF